MAGLVHGDAATVLDAQRSLARGGSAAHAVLFQNLREVLVGDRGGVFLGCQHRRGVHDVGHRCGRKSGGDARESPEIAVAGGAQCACLVGKESFAFG